MFSYTASKPKPKHTKVPAQLIQHFKNTPELPKRSYKQNQNPKQVNLHPDIKIAYKNEGMAMPITATAVGGMGGDRSLKCSKSKVVEEDITKIADSYVLEGNFLKKCQAYEGALKKDKRKVTQIVDKQNLQNSKTFNRKQILKLEYLQKMGFLRPEQKKILSQIRKFESADLSHISHTQTSIKKQQPQYKPQNPKNYEQRNYETPNETFDPLSFYSPKNMDLKRYGPQLFSSNSRYMLPPHMMTKY